MASLHERQPIVTDRVAWSVGHKREHYAIWDVDSSGPRNHVLNWGWEGAGPGHAQTWPGVDVHKATQ